MVCSGPNCGRTSDRIAEEFEVQIKIAGLRQEIQVIRGSCMGLCSSGPNVIMFPEGTIYSHVQIQDAARIVNEHLLKGNRVEELLYDETRSQIQPAVWIRRSFSSVRHGWRCATAE